MSTLQHINSVLDHFWPEYSRRFPAFDKPEIVPAETLRGMAPVYMRRLIDQDPSSFYLFVHADPMRGDASRERMVEFVDDLFYEKLRMPSSYDIEAGAGGDLPRDQAVDKEVMPARDDREYQRYSDEQMAAAEAQRAEQERQKRIERLGFDPDDGNTIDVGDYSPAPSSRSVGQAGTSAVGMPKRIWYCVDFHCPSGGMLGYSGGRGGRLNGRRRSGGYLREAISGSPVSDILRAYNWARTNPRYSASLMPGLQAIAMCSPASDANAENAAIHSKFNLYIFKYGNGRTTWVEESVDRPGSFTITFKDIADATHEHWSRTYQTLEATVVTIDEIRRMTTIAEDDTDPEKMMKEFVEKKEDGEVEEDEYRRPKNQPHNLHSVDEGDEEFEDESEKPFELNESLVRFCDRLIRG